MEATYTRDGPVAFGYLLRRLRKARDVTQAALAEQAGCSTGSIKKIEAGIRRPSKQLAAQFADCLGLQGAERAAFLAAARAPMIGRTITNPDPAANETWAIETMDDESAAETMLPPRHSNLPQQVTTFVGRSQEIALIKSLLSGLPSRMVTLTGAGGCGKTRLALRVASDLGDLDTNPYYHDGVCWVELAPLSDPLLVPEAVAAALGMHVHPLPSPTEQLIGYLRSKALLLVLDNCEHLIDASAELADALLRSCPSIRILATSREALGLSGETSYVVPSLSLPDATFNTGGAGAGQVSTNLMRLGETEAVCLFVERAKAVWPGFALTAENAVAVVQICRRLDGIPLALELAAARVKLLRVDEIATHLDTSFGLLAGGSRRAPERHQTLKAAIDWSYNLLTSADRVLLGRLAVFVGGFTVEAALAVCAGERLPRTMIFDGLARLVDKSLVVVHQEHQPTRYRLLEPIRQYARDRLLEVREGQEVDAVGYAHAHFYLAFAEKANPELWGAAHTTWLARLMDEHDNERAAVQWAVEHEDATLAVRLALALYWFWFLCGFMSEGRRLATAVLAVAESSGGAEEQAGGLLVAGHLDFLEGDNAPATRAYLEESAAIYRRLGDRKGLALALNGLGLAVLFAGDSAAASAILAEVEVLFREVGDISTRGFLVVGLTAVAIEQGDYAGARAYGGESLAIYQAAGNRWGMAITLNYLGDVARCEADYRLAESFYLRSRSLFEESGVRAESASGLHNLGYVALGLGDCQRAKALFTESLTLHGKQGNRAGALEALAGFSGLLVTQGEARRGAALYGAVAALRETYGTPLWPAERVEGERYLAKMRTLLGQQPLQTALAEGRGMTLEQAIAYAQESLGRISSREQQAEKMAWGGLTGREREVVSLIARGKSNREIAEILIVTERTVETHINHIRSKLALTSRAQIAVWVVERGQIVAKSQR